MSLRTRLIKLSVALVAAILSLLLLEVAYRGYLAASEFFSRDDEPKPPPVPLHVVTGTPKLYGLNPDHPDISSQGLRDDEVAVPKPAGTFRILVLGDSVAYGSSVERGKTFSNLLEARLREQFGPIEVVNAGVMGYTPYNELQYYLTEGRKLDPDLVIVAFCMNDVANPRLHWGDAPGVKIPDEAIPNLVYDHEHILPKVRKLEAEQKGGAARAGQGTPLLKHSKLYEAMKPAVKRLLGVRSRNEADDGSATPTYITGEDTLSIKVLLDRTTPEWRWLASIYDRLREAVRADHAALMIAVFPLAYQLDEGYPFFPQRQIDEYCRESSTPCLDMLSSFSRHPKADIFVLDKEGHDDIWHLTGKGHEVSAEEILRFLKEQSLLPAGQGAGS